MSRTTFTLHFFLSLLSVAGCAGNVQNKESADHLYLTGTWRVEDIDQGGVIDNSMITVQFEESGQISGSTGCNQYSSVVTISAQSFSTSSVSLTRRACMPTIMAQEQRFLDAWNEVSRYEIVAETWLVLYDSSGTQRLKLIQHNQNKLQPAQSAQSGSQLFVFRCDGAGIITIRSVGPETVELTVNGHITGLQQFRTASGIQYRNVSILFWNKGNEALLNRNGQEHNCSLESF